MDAIKKEILEIANIIKHAATSIDKITEDATYSAAQAVADASLLSAIAIKKTAEKTAEDVAIAAVLVAGQVKEINAQMAAEVAAINAKVVERMTILVEYLALANRKYKAAERKIKLLAFYDVLTKLPNRRKLLDRMKDSIKLSHRDGKKFAVLMLDLDKFKIVNDTLGHAAGDDLLKQVAKIITSRLRESDMVARLGGDEFVIILEDCSAPLAAEKVAAEIIADLAEPFKLLGKNVVQIGASVGISFYPSHGITPTKLISAADRALYQAKENGRGCFCISNPLAPRQTKSTYLKN
jgi:diguanylate cyclase (GGDEF)-like protein